MIMCSSGTQRIWSFRAQCHVSEVTVILCGTNDFISAQSHANVPFLFVHVWFYAWLQCSENFDVLWWPHMTYWLTSYMNGWHLQSMHASHSVNFEMLSFREQRIKRGMEILHWSWSELELAITDLAYDRRRLFCMVRRVPLRKWTINILPYWTCLGWELRREIWCVFWSVMAYTNTGSEPAFGESKKPGVYWGGGITWLEGKVFAFAIWS